MGSLFRQRVTRPLPAGAVIVKQGDKLVAKWKNRSGKPQSAEVTCDGSKVTTISAVWSARYRDGSDRQQTVSTGCRDKSAANRFLTELERQAELIRSKTLTQTDIEIGNWQTVPLEQHIEEYLADLRDRGVNLDRLKTSGTYLRGDADGCGFRWLHDLNADRLRRWLRSSKSMSAATYNWHAGLWVAFGWWLTGRRITGKRPTNTGERRLSTNPFDGFGKLSERDDRRREARALTVDEMRRLLQHARSRPLQDALKINRGPRIGEQAAKLTPQRRQALERLGEERALIYMTALLTGLRRNELSTLRVGDLSFGDVPFVKLRPKNEKNRKGSSIPLRADLAADLRRWVAGRGADDLVFNVPSGLLRIFNRDLIAAGIDKLDEQNRRVHLHALRHTLCSQLSVQGVSPRVAQAVMRHSDLKLTMSVYTDERLLSTAAAVELLPDLTTGTTHRSGQAEMTEGVRTVTQTVTQGPIRPSVKESQADSLGRMGEGAAKSSKTKKAREKRGFLEWAIQGSNLLPLPCERTGDRSPDPYFTGSNETAVEMLHKRLHNPADLERLAALLRDQLDDDERRKLAVELLR